jgi:hypothetical protein
MAEGSKLMSKELLSLENAAFEARANLCEKVFGYPGGTFDNHISIVEELPKEIADIPTITRRRDGAHLTLSLSGARVWADAIGEGCDSIGVDSNDMYAASGIALLELANVVNYSARFDDPVARLRRVDKAFRKDLSPQNVAAVFSEQTGINFTSIIAGLDNDDMTAISKLRYGIGVALKCHGIDGAGKKTFGTSNVDEAVKAIRNYRLGVTRFLEEVIFLEEVDLAETSSGEVIERVYDTEFPFLRIAACLPMNVEYLLNK